MDEYRAPAEDPAHRASTSEHAAHAARPETLGQLGSQLAHDFNNILAVAMTSIEMAMRIGDPEKAQAFLLTAIKTIERGRSLTDRLAAVSLACGTPIPVDVHAAIGRRIASRDSLKFTTILGASRCTIHSDPAFLDEALDNLFDDAAGAANGSAVSISTRDVTGVPNRSNAGRACIAISVQNGAELSDDARARAFELFSGTHGMRLAQARDCARRAGGFASITSEAGQGTTVTLTIPLDDSTSLTS